MIYVLIGAVVIFLLFALAIATYSTAQLEDTFEKCNNVPCNRKITGGEFALQLTNNNFNSQINIGRTKGYLNDGYSSKSRMVVLSDATCDISSVGALTVVAHEFGHAEQDLTNSKKFKLNKTLSKVVKIIGYFMF
ncbi:MAG: zinc metallopeptidase, partial [Firmicutes bacterium]|nr:zinc metallopeptidase [Bacillota bacterium]